MRTVAERALARDAVDVDTMQASGVSGREQAESRL